MAVLERQLRDVRDQLAESVGQTVDAASVRKTLREFDGIWAEMTPREQEKFVKTLVDRVTYDGATCTVTVGFRTAGIRQLCLEVEKQMKMQDKGFEVKVRLQPTVRQINRHRLKIAPSVESATKRGGFRESRKSWRWRFSFRR